MQPISPVIDGHNEVIIAEHQPEYQNLPAVITKSMVTTRWKLTAWERIHVLLVGSIYLQVLTFGKALQPVALGVKAPVIPVE